MPADLRDRILADFAALKVPLTADAFDTVLARAEREGLSHQQFLHRLIAEQADQRRERSIAARIREARFAERKPLAVGGGSKVQRRGEDRAADQKCSAQLCSSVS
jgi:IstB-like ATP binding protein